MLALVRRSTCVLFPLLLVAACGGKVGDGNGDQSGAGSGTATNNGGTPNGGNEANTGGADKGNLGWDQGKPTSIADTCERECRRVLKTVCYDWPANYDYAYGHCMPACKQATDAQRAELAKCTPAYPCDPKCMRLVGYDSDPPGH